MPIVKNLKEARRLPVRVEEQQAQQLAVNPPRSAGDGRQEIQPTAMVPIELPVLGNTGSLRTMQVALNRQGSDYGGGSLVFATRDGLLRPERPPGSYTMHHWCVPHGVTALRWGARYSLFLQTARRPFAAG